MTQTLNIYICIESRTLTIIDEPSPQMSSDCTYCEILTDTLVMERNLMVCGFGDGAVDLIGWGIW